MRAVFVFPAFLAARNLSPTSCGLFAFKLVFSHYRNLLGQLEFPFSSASVWKLRFLLEGPSRLSSSCRQWDVVTYSHRGDQIAWESRPNPRQAWRVSPRRRWGLGGGAGGFWSCDCRKETLGWFSFSISASFSHLLKKHRSTKPDARCLECRDK